MHHKSFIIAIFGCFLTACASEAPPLQGQWQQRDADGQVRQTLQLKQGQLAASAGCNRLFGPARVEQGHLLIGTLGRTLMACPPDLMQREQALVELLQSRPRLQLQQGSLLLGEGEAAVAWQAVEDLSDAPLRFIYVAAERRPCTGVAPMQCLQVREDSQQPWQHYYGEIEGFQPEPGVSYRLRIREVAVPNPPADAADRRWVLDSIVEQIRIAP